MTRAHILVVEDEGIVALQVRTTLEQYGFRVTDTCASGEEALASVERQPPDLILMDLKLQGPLDGIATAAAIRASNRIPVVYLTAHSEDATIERARVTEPYGYLLKPFNPRELCITVEVALHKHRIDEEKRALTVQLEAALAKVKLLSGFLPICASCKKIRNSGGQWTQMEVYIRDHSEAEFSHGFCPECLHRHYPEFIDQA
ncbi:MAG: response regulator [Acidobacteriota bacterium]